MWSTSDPSRYHHVVDGLVERKQRMESNKASQMAYTCIQGLHIFFNGLFFRRFIIPKSGLFFTLGMMNPFLFSELRIMNSLSFFEIRNSISFSESWILFNFWINLRNYEPYEKNVLCHYEPSGRLHATICRMPCLKTTLPLIIHYNSFLLCCKGYSACIYACIENDKNYIEFSILSAPVLKK